MHGRMEQGDNMSCVDTAMCGGDLSDEISVSGLSSRALMSRNEELRGCVR